MSMKVLPDAFDDLVVNLSSRSNRIFNPMPIDDVCVFQEPALLLEVQALDIQSRPTMWSRDYKSNGKRTYLS